LTLFKKIFKAQNYSFIAFFMHGNLIEKMRQWSVGTGICQWYGIDFSNAWSVIASFAYITNKRRKLSS